MVYRTRRLRRQGGRAQRLGQCERVTARARALRHLRHAQRRRLVVLAGRVVHCANRPKNRESRIVEPPTQRQGARRVWSDSRGRIWVSEWNSGNLSVHDPALGTGANSWRTWKAPGAESHVYAVYVDDKDIVWASEWSNNAMLRFDPKSEKFDVLTMPRTATNIRQILGRPGEVWLPESATEFISVIRTA